MRTLSSARRAAAVLAAAALAAAVPVLAAPAASAATSGPGWVRAAHLVPDLPKMDIDLRPLVGGHPGPVAGTVAGAGYGDVSTYSKVPAGAYEVAIRPVGSAQDATPVVTGTVQVASGGAYTIAALGTAASATIVPLNDDLTPPAAGHARVRVISAAAKAASVDVRAEGGPVLITGAAFGHATGYADVPAGRWTLHAAASAGTTSSDAPGRTDVKLAAGSTYTLAVTSTPSGLAVTPVADAVGSGQVPVGGAATGAGGTAPASGARTVQPAAAAGAGALAATGAAAVVLLVRSRRRPALR